KKSSPMFNELNNMSYTVHFFIMFFFFFFQAEDGIRDLYVTGVQTCALPILVDADAAFVWIEFKGGVRVNYTGAFAAPGVDTGWRSEERRVGKECRYGRAP